MSEAPPDSSTVKLPARIPENTSDSELQAKGARQGAVDSSEILRGQKTVDISHNGSTYRLQATRLGKLILTK